MNDTCFNASHECKLSTIKVNGKTRTHAEKLQKIFKKKNKIWLKTIEILPSLTISIQLKWKRRTITWMNLSLKNTIKFSADQKGGSSLTRKTQTIRLRACRNLFNFYLVCFDNREKVVNNNCTSVRTGEERSSFKREKTSTLASKWSLSPTSLKT